MNITIEPLPDNLPQRPLPEKLGFGQIFSDRMFTQEWTKAEGWHDARIGPYKPFVLDPATAVFHYAQEIFEGHEGLSPARRQGQPLPAVGERRALQPLGQAHGHARGRS